MERRWLGDTSRIDQIVMKVPLLENGRIDIDALGANIDWSQISAFESALLTFQDIKWEGIVDEVRETPELARFAWKDGETLLCLAAHDNQFEVVRFLINCGADVNQMCRQATPIWGAVWSGNPAIVDLLLSSGANASISVSCEHGWSPLHLAAREGYEDIVQRLLEENPDVNATDDEGFTPLDQAAQMQHAEVVRLLIDKNARYLASSSKKFIDSLNEITDSDNK